MWLPSTDFSLGFGAGISFFLLVELIRCIRVCCKKETPIPTRPDDRLTYQIPSAPLNPYPTPPYT